MEICPTYISKIRTDCEKQIISLMIPNDVKKTWHYLAAKELSASLKETTSKHDEEFKFSGSVFNL